MPNEADIDLDAAERVVEEHLNKLVTAKLMPLTETVDGLNLAFVTLTDVLDKAGTVKAEAIATALKGTLESLKPEHAVSQSAETLRGLISVIEAPARGETDPVRH